MWENIGACFCSELQSWKMVLVSNSPTFNKSLMVCLYWNCCWNITQRWFFKSSMAIKASQCLPIFNLTKSCYENRGISHAGLLPMYMLESVDLIFLTDDVFHPRSHNPANMPGPSILCLWWPQNSVKGPKRPVNKIGRTFIANNTCH